MSHTFFLAKRCLFCIIALLISLPLYPGTKRALLVGVSNYARQESGSWRDIHGASDVKLIEGTLKSKHFKTTTITNEAATAKRIRKELESLTSSCQKGDIVYIHFSCHGQQFEDMKPFDESDGWDESIIPYDAAMNYCKGKYEGKNHIVDDELSGYFQRIRKAIGPKGFLCVVVDACYSGGAQKGEDWEDEEENDETFLRGTNKAFSPNGKVYNPSINKSSHFCIPKEKGLGEIVIFEACRAYQSNFEINQGGNYYGPLSFYINQSLQSYEVAPNLKWIRDVRKRMESDPRLVRQNMVYEASFN